MRSLALFLGVAGSFATPYTTTAQGVVVDQGSFAITIDGREAGREEFTIRRAGLGGDAAMFANATIVLTRGGRETRILPLLRASRVQDACVIADRRLLVSGVPPLRGVVSLGEAADPARLLAALLLPVRNEDLHRLLELVEPAPCRNFYRGAR
jgi:hypothetical protein